MSNLTLPQIIQDYRNKAKEFNAIADRLELDYSTPQARIATTLTMEMVQGFIEQKNSARVASIAKHFMTSKETVNQIINDSPAVFEKADKGWIKLKQ